MEFGYGRIGPQIDHSCCSLMRNGDHLYWCHFVGYNVYFGHCLFQCCLLFLWIDQILRNCWNPHRTYRAALLSHKVTLNFVWLYLKSYCIFIFHDVNVIPNLVGLPWFPGNWWLPAAATVAAAAASRLLRL